jgi:hypothetical protein
MADAFPPIKPVANPEDGETGGEDYVTEIITETLGSIPTRVIVVEELHNCGVISGKKMRKRIQRIMEDMELKSVEITTLGDEQ